MVVVLLALSIATTSYNISLVAGQEALLSSLAVRGPIPMTDPESANWQKTVSLQVPLSAQITTRPMNPNPSIRTVTVRSLNNGTWIAFHFVWRDSTSNMTTLKTESFRDSVAIQFPRAAVNAQPFVCMGQLPDVVNIWHWKADWQKDIDVAFQELADAYPDFWVNFYPFALGGPPYSIPPPDVTKINKTFIAGWAAGNQFSNPLRVTPVEDLVAGGFGSLTSQAQQDVIGRGVWKDGIWSVVMARPLKTNDKSDAQFSIGENKAVAFAVWDGANNEVNGRKSVSAWVVLNVLREGEAPQQPSTLEAPSPASAFATIASIALLIFSLVFIIAVIVISSWKEKQLRRASESRV